MSLPVHWAPELASAQVGADFDLTGAEAHHAIAVRRLRVGESLALTDGEGLRAEAVVSALAKGRLTVQIASLQKLPQPKPQLLVVQAIPKGERGELAVELLTEIGVHRIVPWAASRCVSVWRGDKAKKNQAKWQSVAQAAAKQSRRTWWPVVDSLADTATVARLLSEADLGVVLTESATGWLADCRPPESGLVVLVVGPEGGFTDLELRSLTEAGAQVMRLGEEVLRTSTAGVAACASLLTHTVRWRGSLPLTQDSLVGPNRVAP